MKTDNAPHCPFHAMPETQPGTPATKPPGSWPPGPPSGLTGWRFLRTMQRDVLGAMSKWQQQYGGLVHLRIWPEHQILVTEPQLVRELLVTQHTSLIRWERGIEVMAQLHGGSVLTAEGEAWKSKRKTLQAGFSPQAVLSNIPFIVEAADAAFAGWNTQGPGWSIEDAFTDLGMRVILKMVFSSDIDAEAESAARAIHTVSVLANNEMYFPVSMPDWMPWKGAKRRSLATLKALIDRHVQARLYMSRYGWPDDLLSRTLALHDADPVAWPLQAVKDECMTAFLAGHETVAATLTWWSWCMAAHPAAQAQARAEVDTVLQGRAPAAADLPALAFLSQTLQETMRLYPAAPLLLMRRSVAPITLDGWTFPAKTLFTVPVGVIQRDPRWFAEPNEFRPERFAPGAPELPRGAVMPFGTGPRVCLGQHLATAEMTLVAAMCLQRFAVSVPEGMDAPEPLFNITLRPRDKLRLRLTPRS